MIDINAYIGQRIKFFRRMNGLTIENLAHMIHKSKSAVSKYENGQVVIDIETLHDIAHALNTTLYRLTYYKEPSDEDVPLAESKLFEGATQMYTYYYKKSKKEIVRSVLQLSPDDENNEIHVDYYMGIRSYPSFMESKFFYSGSLISYDMLTYFFLENNANSIERVYMCFFNPLGGKKYTMGLATGITDGSVTPLAMPILISKTPITDEEFLVQQLELSKEDFKQMKTTNMMLIHT